ncbi:MAG: N-acetylmannosamine-6-phosphate 2-epimerase [Vulcanimicrobiaceae bacterium]
MKLDGLRGGLIVSVQAPAGSALDDPHAIAAIARAAQDGGAVGVRIQGAANLQAVRRRVSVPVVGLIKREYAGFAPYITPTLEEVRAVAETGAEIVAFDATGRARPGGISVARIVDAILAAGCVPMADCATADDAVCARAAGAQILATTLCGYTDETKGIPLPALAMVRELAELEAFAVCEGGVSSPQDCLAAREAGADAVVVGNALTGIEARVRDFAVQLEKRA